MKVKTAHVGGTHRNLTVESARFVLERATTLRVMVGNISDVVGVVSRGVGSTTPPMSCEATKQSRDRRASDILAAQPEYTNTLLHELFAVSQSFGIDCKTVSPVPVSYAGTRPSLET